MKTTTTPLITRHSRIFLAFFILSISLSLSACGTLKSATSVSSPIASSSGVLGRFAAALFTRAAMDDFIWEGAVTSNNDIAVEIASSADPNLAAIIQLAIATHLIESSGPRVLRITLVGESTPRIFICRATMAVDCELPSNAGVKVWAAPISAENLGILIVHRISIKTGG